jgi:hypothetical protein
VAPNGRCALAEYRRASPSGPLHQAPHGVGCGQSDHHEHARLAPRLRVRSFPATIDPAGTTTSADFSTAHADLSAVAVPCHPATTPHGVTGHPRTPMEISPGKASNLHCAPAASTSRPLDGIGLRHLQLARPDRAASNAIRVPRVAASPPASFPPRLAATQLPSACGWCHQPPRGTRTPELLVMLGALPGPGALQRRRGRLCQGASDHSSARRPDRAASARIDAHFRH